MAGMGGNCQDGRGLCGNGLEGGVHCGNGGNGRERAGVEDCAGMGGIDGNDQSGVIGQQWSEWAAMGRNELEGRSMREWSR